MMADPREFAYALLAELGEDIGGGQADGDGVDELVDPEPDLVSQDGAKRAYSADTVRALLANAEQRLTRRLTGEMRPALEYAERGAQGERMAALRAEAQTTARDALTAARMLPHFKENEPAISKVLASIDPRIRQRVGSVAALYMAYNKVLADTVLPNLSTVTRDATVAEMTRSAAAGASTVGTHAAAGTKPVLRDGDVDGLARHMERLHAGG
jgi:hypothetical protein